MVVIFKCDKCGDIEINPMTKLIVVFNDDTPAIQDEHLCTYCSKSLK